MSREIDMSNLEELSPEDLLYLRDRNRLTPEQERDLIDESDWSDDDEDQPYEKWTLAELGDEIDERNEDLPEEDRLEKPKKKADRIAVLKADDVNRPDADGSEG